MGKNLFPSDVPQKKWESFAASGFAKEVVGVVYRAGQAVCGLPLGGIATGAVDLDTDGTLGRCTIFNSIIPPRELGALPFLGLAVGDQVWALTTKSVKGAKNVKDIHYWGHYPIADLQYVTDAPVSVSLRAWSPFLPGDAEGSNTPGQVYEVRLSNDGKTDRKGSIVLTFPGPTSQEVSGENVANCDMAAGYRGDPAPAAMENISKSDIAEKNLNGVYISTGNNTGYVLAAIGEKVRTGGDLNANDGAWAAIAKQLPKSSTAGASVAVDFDLKAGESKSVRFVLTWYYPTIISKDVHMYIHAYGPRFSDAVAVAKMLAGEHELLLNRVVAWQEVIYGEKTLPDWLRDTLVNNFHLLAEDAFWEANSLPEEDWARETGMYCMVESTRTCPGQSCIPSDWYGNWPVVFFFPKLAHGTIRGFAHLQLPNGEIPIYWGQMYERQNPVYQLLHVTSAMNYIDLVDRVWQRTGDNAILFEMYPSVKKAVRYLQSLDSDADGLVDCHVGAMGHQFYGEWMWLGAATHVAGMGISTFRMAERMAERVGDTAFANDCKVWLNLAAQSLEKKLWNGNYYLLYHDTTNGLKDDTILANQLAGQFCCDIHGVADAFPPDRVARTIETIKKTCVPAAKWGATNALRPDGSINREAKHQSKDIFNAENIVLAMTMIYAGDRETGLRIAYENMENLILEKGLAWDMPNTVTPDKGEPTHGHDFDQMMVMWALPSAMAGQTLAEVGAPGGLVDRIIQAGAR